LYMAAKNKKTTYKYIKVNQSMKKIEHCYSKQKIYL
jgi:hypothetical protein